MRKNIINLMLIAFVSVAMASCGNPSKMIEAADQIKINCNPEVLEVIAGNIDAVVDVTFPAEYFHPKAILEVIPVLVYSGGQVEGKPFVYQGEKITDNYKLVTEDGATISERIHFEYVPGMEKSQLVARAKVFFKGKEFPFPADIKIADGANTTYMLVETDGAYEMMKDNYQEVIPETEEAQILYLVNSATVRPSQLRSDDIKNFEQALKDLEQDGRREVKGTKIVAYASPEGAVDFNNKLSANREKSAEKAFNRFAKKLETGEVSTKSLGEDWEGFQELVKNSNIEDKELILRVLSMYSDSNVREREIRNMSQVYKTLAETVLPELRRARFITDIEYTNYTADELKELLETNIDALDEEALLRVATLTRDNGAKIDIYNKAIKEFDSDRAKYNAACVNLNLGNNSAAKSLLGKMNNKNCYYKNAMGVIAMREGDYEEAKKWFAETHRPQGKINAAVIDILEGKYKDALNKLEGTGDHNEPLAHILNGQPEKAVVTCKCPHAAYLKAVIAARAGDAETCKKELETAAKREDYAKRMVNDIEFAKILR
ncbi:MAG: hypothetical protein GXY75_02250 [Bacteroidales bacterium]|jgi:hypothetical protein|nr:hypothetical protein [Bacteroidales bacterium]